MFEPSNRVAEEQEHIGQTSAQQQAIQKNVAQMGGPDSGAEFLAHRVARKFNQGHEFVIAAIRKNYSPSKWR